MFNFILWQNLCILTARAGSKDWGTDLSALSKLMHEKSWCNLTLKGCPHRQPGSLLLYSIILYIIIYQNTPVRIYLGQCPRGFTNFFLFHFLTTSKVKLTTPLLWSMTFSACQVLVEFCHIFGHTVMLPFPYGSRVKG